MWLGSLYGEINQKTLDLTMDINVEYYDYSIYVRNHKKTYRHNPKHPKDGYGKCYYAISKYEHKDLHS